MTGNKSGNYAAWIIIIVVGFGMLSFVFYMIFKNVKQKKMIDNAANKWLNEIISAEEERKKINQNTG